MHYRRRDVLAAMERAVRYRAFSFASLERILTLQAEPKTLPPSLAESYRSPLGDDDDPIHPRATTEYQPLLFDESTDDEQTNDTPNDQAHDEEKDTREEDDASGAA